MTFTKLFTSITESTIWVAPDTHRLCWITMLAMSDRNGRVWGSVPGLANRARVSVDDTRAALKSFLSPDKDSRTQEHEGRRIEEIDGGWRLLNHAKYRAIRDEETIKESKRNYINTRREAERVENVDRGRANADASTDSENSKPNPIIGLKPDLKALRKEAAELLTFLNEKTKRSYQPVPVNIDMIVARLKEGNTPEDCRAIIAKKCREWLSDEKMNLFLRPKTLFNRTNFAQYRGEVGNG